MVASMALVLDATLVVFDMLCFHEAEHLDRINAAFNSARIITSNEPARPAATFSGSVFELWFAVIGGIGCVIVVTVILAPVVQRVLHAFHVEPPGGDSKPHWPIEIAAVLKDRT